MPEEKPEDDRIGQGLIQEDQLADSLDQHSAEIERLRSKSQAIGEESEMVDEHLEALGYK